MRLYIVSFLGLFVLMVSCKTKQSREELRHIEALHYKDVLELTKPDSAFVFCMDSINSIKSYNNLFDEYCTQRDKKVYVYLSSYDAYLQVYLLMYCNNDYGAIYDNRGLRFYVNKDLEWLIDDEYYKTINQDTINNVIRDYYNMKLKRSKSNSQENYMKYSPMIIPDFQVVTNKELSDSIFVSIVKGYYSFINEIKDKNVENSGVIFENYPLNIVLQSYIYLSPPSLSSKLEND